MYCVWSIVFKLIISVRGFLKIFRELGKLSKSEITSAQPRELFEIFAEILNVLAISQHVRLPERCSDSH